VQEQAHALLAHGAFEQSLLEVYHYLPVLELRVDQGLGSQRIGKFGVQLTGSLQVQEPLLQVPRATQGLAIAIFDVRSEALRQPVLEARQELAIQLDRAPRLAELEYESRDLLEGFWVVAGQRTQAGQRTRGSLEPFRPSQGLDVAQQHLLRFGPREAVGATTDDLVVPGRFGESLLLEGDVPQQDQAV